MRNHVHFLSGWCRVAVCGILRFLRRSEPNLPVSVTRCFDGI
jgi:hypothetical protein